MKRTTVLLLCLLILLYSFAGNSDSLRSKMQIEDLCSVQMMTKDKPSLIQWGFRVGTNFALTKDLSVNDYMDKLVSGEFGAFIRVGRYVYAEVGIGYMFNKGTFEMDIDTLSVSGAKEVIEARYLQVPIKLVGYIPIVSKIAIQPHVGVIYQPLIKVTDNNFNYTMNNLQKNQFLATAGLGVKLFFVTVDISYRQSLQTFFSDRDSKKPAFINLMVGFQF
jgi:hypothetical protein